ncbi:MAG: (d)CMP kinase [Actinomycetota bacterium]
MGRLRVIAIDGPAGAGKSTIARRLARALDLEYLDTGARYRAVTADALHRGWDVHDESAIGPMSREIDIEVGLESVVADGIDVTDFIRGPEVTGAVSTVAAMSSVRQEMRERQRHWGETRGGGVIEGRDIGTVVFPDAILKVFLTASPRVRAERRVAEMGGDVQAIEQSIRERDFKDSSRSDSPLAESNDAVTVDTSDRSIDDVVEGIMALLVERETARGIRGDADHGGSDD